MKNFLEKRPAPSGANQKDRQAAAGLHGWALLGFAILSALVALLYLFILYEAWVLHSLGGLLVAFILLGLCAALIKEARQPVKISGAAPARELLLIGFCHVAGAWVTYELSHSFGLGAVLASALVGLLGGVLFPRYGAPIFCGSFVGMCSNLVIVQVADLLLAASIAGVVYILARQVLNGFGGKLGTIAFSGALLAGLGLKRQFLIAPIPPFDLAWFIVLYATAAAVLTYWLSTSFKWGPVRASGAVGLAGGLLLPALHPVYGGTLAVVAFCASFTGMSAAERLPGMKLMTLAGLFTGIIFLYSMPVFGGAGGKLGTIAFGASLAVRGYLQIFSRFAPK